jgi:hypothetical protein
MALHMYQLRIFDGEYEVLASRTHMIDLDLDMPTIGGTLNRQLHSLTRAATAANEPMDAPRLEVWDGPTKVLDWTGA